MRALLMVVVVACSACASTGATPRPFPVPGARGGTIAPGAPSGPRTGGSPLPVRAGGYEISGTALSLRGKPYRSGGDDLRGFDCSGFVRYVFAQHGVPVPRTVSDQYRAGAAVQPADLQPGDLVFFSTTSPGASHVGILVGGNSFVHAPATSGAVRVDSLGAPYWSSRFIGAKRIQ